MAMVHMSEIIIFQGVVQIAVHQHTTAQVCDFSMSMFVIIAHSKSMRGPVRCEYLLLGVSECLVTIFLSMHAGLHITDKRQQELHGQSRMRPQERHVHAELLRPWLRTRGVLVQCGVLA